MIASLGDSSLGPKPTAKRLAVLMAVLLIGWVVALVVLSKHHPRRPANVPEELPVFEGGYGIERSRAEVADWEQATYKVELSYPSTAVYTFYHQALENEGWKQRLPENEPAPRWRLTGSGPKTRATFYAAWESPDQLRLIQLTLVTTPDQEPPLMQVAVERSRAILPEPRGRP